VGEAIGHVGRSDNAHQFAKHCFRHSFGDRGGPMRRDAVFAAVGRADGDVDQFADERIQFAGAAHHFFERRPGSLKSWRMIGDGFPKIIDVVSLSRDADVIVDFADQAATLFVFDQWLNGIVPSAK
jgi:hypothetical protein